MRSDATTPAPPGAFRRFGAGLAGVGEVQSAPQPQETPQPVPREPLRGRPRTMRVGSRIVRSLRTPVEVEHLTGADLTVCTKSGWLPDDEFFGLDEQRVEHDRLVAEAERAESALIALREQVRGERQRRVEQMTQGGARRPRVDGDRLIAEAEELAVAAQARVVKFADEVMGLIAARGEEWLAALVEKDEQAQRAVAEARAALKAAEVNAGASYAMRRWLQGQGVVGRREPFQICAWSRTAAVPPPPAQDPAQAAMLRQMSGWA